MPPFYAKVFQHINSEGISLDLNVAADGRSGIPADQFSTYNLQDEISEIHYKLPIGTALVLYTGRFFKNVDGDIAVWWDDQPALRDFIRNEGGPVIGTFGHSPLCLKGTNSDEVVRLNEVAGGEYNDRIRSSKLISID